MCSRNEESVSGTTSNKNAVGYWPTNEARQAYLLRPSAASDGGADEGGLGQDSYCRLNCDETSGMLQLVTCPAPPPQDPPMQGGNNAQDEAPVSTAADNRILDEMSVADIIGAELEVRFPGDDSDNDDQEDAADQSKGKVTTAHGWTGSLSSNRNVILSDLDALDADIGNPIEGIVGDVGAGSGYVSGRTCPVADVGADCDTNDEVDPPMLLASDLTAALNKMQLPEHPSEGEVPVQPRRNNRNKAVAYLHIYCYPRPEMGRCGLLLDKIFGNSGGNDNDDVNKGVGADPDPTRHLAHRQANHRRFEVAPTEDFAAVRAVVRAIRALANGDVDTATMKADKPRRYLVVVNPYSGTGQGETIYNTTVKPMLEQAGIDHDVCITEWSGHAMDRMGKITRKNDHADGGDNDISMYDGLIAMGGDGILWEMLQGIRTRPDSDEVLHKLAIGIVGCGTSNGLAKSILHQSMEKYSPLESTFLICKGRTAFLDLSKYETITGKNYTGFLTFSWAFIADVDLDSECIRWMGVARNDVWAAYRILLNRSYKARFLYLPPSAGAVGEAVKLPPLTGPLPTQWKTIDGDFVLFWASQVTHAAYNTFQSPLSQMQDGLFRIMVVRKPISRPRMIQIALAIETGGHIRHDQCEMYECVAFRLEPLEEGSHNDLDGEKIEDGPIQAAVLPAAARFFSGAMG